MKKDLSISILLDYYGKVLTSTQFDTVDLYYNEDLSLAEIAEHFNISRQGVRDSIKRGECILIDMEEKLQIINKLHKHSKALDEIKKNSLAIIESNEKTIYNKTVMESAQNIIDVVEQLSKGDINGI